MKVRKLKVEKCVTVTNAVHKNPFPIPSYHTETLLDSTEIRWCSLNLLPSSQLLHQRESNSLYYY
jgi:hypothetical protein